MRTFFSLVVLWSAAAVACSGTAVVDSDGTGGSGAATSSSSAGGSGGNGCSANGDCVNDSDCPGATKCVPLTACGFKVCEQPLAEATECTDPVADDCCSSNECGPEAACFLWPHGPQCGGVQPFPYNRCVPDECQTDSDCPGTNPPFVNVCTPTQVLGFPTRTCLLATCRVDADCNAEAGGVCAPVQTACCSSTNILSCVYPSNGCRSQSDCNPNEHCEVQNQAARCLDGDAICPA